jgi:hypothetical protein
VDPKKPSSKPPEKNFAPWLFPPELWGFFCPLPQQQKPTWLSGWAFLVMQGLSEFQGNTLKRLALDDKTRKKT